jgi:hypothetical protein|nr:MAG TPA: hypothetical protein [Caudoviricetes sp.]
MFRKLLVENDVNTNLSVVLDRDNEIFICLESRMGREIFQPSLKQVLKLKHTLDEYISDTFELEAQDNV